jgi:serine/threonine protein kinase
MRTIETGKKPLLSLSIGDKIAVSRKVYSFEASATGGMGHVAFVTLCDEDSEGTVNSLPRRLALKTSKRDAPPILDELQKWSLMQHYAILPLEDILFSEIDGLVAVSERCDGSVRDFLAAGRNVNERVAYAIVRSTAEALCQAWRDHRIVHLDIKPENLLYATNARGQEWYSYCVSDWGISSTKTQAVDLGLMERGWSTNNNCGTLPYMSPERFVDGWRSAPPSDIFSVGIMWLELLAGRLPYDLTAQIQPQLLSGHYFDTARQILSKLSVKRQTKQLILNCIHPSPVKRCQDWNSVLKKLRPRFSGLKGV